VTLKPPSLTNPGSICSGAKMLGPIEGLVRGLISFKRAIWESAGRRYNPVTNGDHASRNTWRFVSMSVPEASGLLIAL
jgi:hypothetical protein